MSKIKRIIEIDKDLYESIAEKNSDTVEPRQVVRSFQATIADAIKESKPYDDSGDYISRSALKKDIEQGSYDSFEDLWDEVRKAIDNAPTVFDSEAYSQGYKQSVCDERNARPQGEWIPQGGGFSWVFKCSCCGWVDGYPFNERHNFCPNCGADMRGGIDMKGDKKI